MTVGRGTRRRHRHGRMYACARRRSQLHMPVTQTRGLPPPLSQPPHGLQGRGRGVPALWCCWWVGEGCYAQQAWPTPLKAAVSVRGQARVFGWNWIHVWPSPLLPCTISFPQSHASTRHPRTSTHTHPTHQAESRTGPGGTEKQRSTQAGLSIDSSFNMSTFPELSQQTTAKLVLLGEMGSGKSSLVLRYVKGQFFDYQVSHRPCAGAWRGQAAVWMLEAGLLMRSRVPLLSVCPHPTGLHSGSCLPHQDHSRTQCEV